MSFIPFTILSSLEFGTIFILIFIFHNFSFRGYYAHIGFSSFMLSSLSFAIRGDLSSYSPIFSMIFITLFMWLVFRVHILYSFIASVTGYVPYAVLQILIYLILNSQQIVNFQELEDSTLKGYIVPLLTIIISATIAFLFKRKNWYLDWIPDNHKIFVKMNGINLLLLTVTISVLIFVQITISYLDEKGTHINFYVFYSLLVIAFICLLYLSAKKEQGND